MELEPIDKLGKEINFDGVVYWQLNRIMKAGSENREDVSSAIEWLEALLAPYEDAQYKEDMANLIDDVKKSKVHYAELKGIPENKISDYDENIISFLSIKEKLKAIMRLASRANLLPESSITVDF